MSVMTPRKPPPSGGFPVPQLTHCAAVQDGGLDKVCPATETVHMVRNCFQAVAGKDLSLLNALYREDGGRLDIPVYLGELGEEARRVLPTRKLIGEGADHDQAKAATLMRLIEDYSVHVFWESLPALPGVVRGTWSEAQAELEPGLISLEEILQSVRDTVSPGQLHIARQLFDLVPWTFVPALHLGENRTVWIPVEWFRMISARNGCSAGNTVTESIFQGVCELVERHVCAVIVRGQKARPSISLESIHDPMLYSLLEKFAKENIQILLKDFSLGMPVPTVAALVVDPSTFPAQSEIVFTAGTATTPAKAAARALMEAARFGGDFCTKSCYDPFGLPKYGNKHEARWLESSANVQLTSLPDASAADMLDGLLQLTAALRQRNIQMYSLDLTHPQLRIPVHYTVSPGLDFLQRDIQGGVGQYIGRRLAEEAPLDVARRGLEMLGRLIPENAYLNFFRGIMLLRAGDAKGAGEQFAIASSVQLSPDREAMIAYYGACSYVVREDWYGALPWLDRAVAILPAMSEPWSLRGICRFKLHDYAAAAENFKAALRRNRGSAPDFANLGACLMEMGETEQAKACLKTALGLEPDLIPAKQRLDKLTGAA